MRSLTKLDRAMQIKRIEGKAALEQCLLDKQTLKFTSNRFVQRKPVDCAWVERFCRDCCCESWATFSRHVISLLHQFAAQWRDGFEWPASQIFFIVCCILKRSW